MNAYDHALFRLFSVPVLPRGERLARYFRDAVRTGEMSPGRYPLWLHLYDVAKPSWLEAHEIPSSAAIHHWALPLRKCRMERAHLRDVVQALHDYNAALIRSLEAQ